MNSKGVVFILSAASGTGKTTTCKLLKQKLPELKFSVSHTTREARCGESEGVDYYFIPQKDFEEKIKRNEFLEWANVHNQYYGTAFETVERHRQNGEDLLIELDVQGAHSLRNINYKAVFIFIMPPSLKELEARLNKRNTEPPEIINDRLEVGKYEIKQFDIYDYILTNDKVEETAENLSSIIRAERCRKEMYQPSPDLNALLNSKVNT
ncbi:MAG TPA: guanylate kinase [Nitrospinaceae bacterium]|jgi:guanylate kinase|nr:guanylate kinase [Nitrospinaceae bacterium]HJN99732.1 guanylate kinase [Nitrospinaceae bacterium]|tara:strand:- start:2679 stop:3305 length:627 start_codon:yes stop_codon:yes gene_type:complete